MNTTKCNQCGKPVTSGDKFCPHCGAPLSKDNEEIKETKTFVSKGNYSGKMTKGKTSRWWRILRNIIIAIVLLSIISLLIWFQVDPDAVKKLTDVLFGIGVMVIFFFVGWLFMRGKKGKQNSDWDENQYSNIEEEDDD